MAGSTASQYSTQQACGKMSNFFVVVTGETCGAHETFIRQLKGQIQQKSVDQSDYILAFCPISSRTGTDVQGAMGKIQSGKPVILVVMHHSHDGEARLDDSSRHVSRTDVILTVDTVFWEGEFLNCSHNDKACNKVLEAAGHSSSLLKYIWNTITTLAYTPGEPSTVGETRQADGPVARGHFFVVKTGETCGAHDKIITKLERKGLVEKKSVEESDSILAFCPSQTGTDVQEAMGKIPSGKPVILVVMHHTHKVAAPLDVSSKYVSRKDVILTVDTLFWKGEFLKCSHNKEAFRKVLLDAATTKKSTENDSSALAPWRDFGNKDTLLKSVREYRPQKPNIKHIRILLHGPVGSGKSSFINSVNSILKGRMAHGAHVDTVSGGKSYTKKYQTYTIKKGHFVFNDIVGLGSETGVLKEDIILAMEGHVMDGYQFDPVSAMSHEDPLYKHDPKPEDKPHVLVLVFPADQMTTSSLESMKKMKELADQMGIPQICILTKIDKACPLVKEDVKKVYESKNLKEKMEGVSTTVGIRVNDIFPVKNYHDEIDLDDDIDILVLTALQRMIN